MFINRLTAGPLARFSTHHADILYSYRHDARISFQPTRATGAGKATMAQFGATGCVPCEMMQPILAELLKKHQDRLNVVFIHVGEEQILAAGYGISSIPVQMFFDASGRKIFRHTGFLAVEEIDQQLKDMGATK